MGGRGGSGCSRAMPLVEYTSRDGLALLELNAPPANCYSYEMMKELDAAILQARFDPKVHVIVLSGAGEKFFCAGADIAMLKVEATRTLERCARDAMHLLGQRAWSGASRVERIYKEARIFAIGGGTEEVLGDQAAKQLGF